MTWKEATTLIKAKYPIVYVNTYEEDRIVNELSSIRKTYVWKISTGFMNGTTPVEGTQDPISALKHVIDSENEGNYVMLDLHAYINNASVVRSVRDCQVLSHQKGKTLFLVSPIVKIPEELMKTITVLDFNYPDEMQILELVNGACKAMKINNINPEIMSKVAKACKGLTYVEVENVLAKSFAEHASLNVDTIIHEKEQTIKKSGILDLTTKTEMGEVGGLDRLKTWAELRKTVFSDEARAFGLRPPKGILVNGIQGCGKSLIIKALASLWDLPILRLDGGKIYGSLVGESEKNMRYIQKTAESIAPCILWIDEFEKAFSGSGSSGQGDSGTSTRVIGSFLTWLQEKPDDVIIGATSNNVTSLPPELLRKGRFDEIFFVDLPNHNERIEIFKIHIKKKGRDSDNYDLNGLAKFSNGFSGSEIEECINDALYKAFFSKEELSTTHILSSIEGTVPLSVTRKEDITSMREWGKAHATPATTQVTNKRKGGRFNE